MLTQSWLLTLQAEQRWLGQCCGDHWKCSGDVSKLGLAHARGPITMQRRAFAGHEASMLIAHKSKKVLQRQHRFFFFFFLKKILIILGLYASSFPPSGGGGRGSLYSVATDPPNFQNSDSLFRFISKISTCCLRNPLNYYYLKKHWLDILTYKSICRKSFSKKSFILKLSLFLIYFSIPTFLFLIILTSGLLFQYFNILHYFFKRGLTYQVKNYWRNWTWNHGVFVVLREFVCWDNNNESQFGHETEWLDYFTTMTRCCCRPINQPTNTNGCGSARDECRPLSSAFSFGRVFVSM